MVVLSLFDGISCGRVALEKAGIPVTMYMASEINPYAMKITKKNFPGTLFCGDVTKLRVDKLPLIPDLIIGGSPCQGFSFAGKQLNFDDPRSRLFFEYLRILKEVRALNPDVLFLLENVPMKKKFENAISMALMTKPVMIDAALVSAQSRKRLYWCNWHVPQPEDRGIVLKDILQGWEDVKGYVLTDAAVHYMNREVRGGRTHWDFEHHHDSRMDKSRVLPMVMYKGVPYNVIRDARFSDAPIDRALSEVEVEKLQGLPENYTNHVSSTRRYEALGNGWQCDVIQHIFKHMPVK